MFTFHLPKSNSSALTETPEAIGARLREKREEKNLSLEDIAKTTRWSDKQLAAIEQGQWDLFPNEQIARGCLRAYQTRVDPVLSPSWPKWMLLGAIGCMVFVLAMLRGPDADAPRINMADYPRIGGVGKPGSEVQLILRQDTTLTTTVNQRGSWTVTVALAEAGAHTIPVLQAVDKNGHLHVASMPTGIMMVPSATATPTPTATPTTPPTAIPTPTLNMTATVKALELNLQTAIAGTLTAVAPTMTPTPLPTATPTAPPDLTATAQAMQMTIQQGITATLTAVAPLRRLVIGRENAIVRAGPCETCNQLYLLMPGNPINLVGRDQTGHWFLLDSGGWIFQGRVSDPPGQEFPVVDAK